MGERMKGGREERASPLKSRGPSPGHLVPQEEVWLRLVNGNEKQRFPDSRPLWPHGHPFCRGPEVSDREVRPSCLSARLPSSVHGPLNRVALPGVALSPPAQCPPLASKAAPSREPRGSAVPAGSSHGLGRELWESARSESRAKDRQSPALKAQLGRPRSLQRSGARGRQVAEDEGQHPQARIQTARWVSAIPGEL